MKYDLTATADDKEVVNLENISIGELMTEIVKTTLYVDRGANLNLRIESHDAGKDAGAVRA